MLQPLGDRVVIRALVKEEKTKSGIFLPDTATKEKPQDGEVVAVGNGRLLEDGTRSKMEVAVGDKVIFAKYAGTEVKYDGVDYLLLSEKDILALIK